MLAWAAYSRSFEKLEEILKSPLATEFTICIPSRRLKQSTLVAHMCQNKGMSLLGLGLTAGPTCALDEDLNKNLENA